MKLYRPALFVWIVACSLPAFGQVTFKRQYQEGSSYTLDSTNRIRQKLTILGMETDLTADTTATAKISIGQRDAEGKLPLTEKIESLQINMNHTPGGNYFFDSKNPDNKGTSVLEPIRDVHKLMTKMSTTTVLDKDNNIAEVKIDQNQLGALPVQLQDLVREQFNPENMKREAAQRHQQLPSDAVKPGESWQRTENVSFGGGQAMTFESKYTYDGTVEKDGRTLDQISSTTLSVKYALAPGAPLPFTLKGSDLKIAESTGTILFDRELGRVVESKEMTHVVGDLTFQQSGMDLPSKLDLTIETELKVIQ